MEFPKHEFFNTQDYINICDRLMKESYPDDLLNYFEKNHLEINSNFYNKLINQVERLINKEYHNINLILINNPNLNNEKGYQDLKNESRINNLKKWKAYLNERRLKLLPDNPIKKESPQEVKKGLNTLTWKGEKSQLSQLISSLIDCGYIENNPDSFLTFLSVFGLSDFDKPIRWIKKNSKNDFINKKAIINLFKILIEVKLIDEINLCDNYVISIINSHFVINEGSFELTKANFYKKNEGIYYLSECNNELKNIIDKLHSISQ